jgi:hypothetical protein
MRDYAEPHFNDEQTLRAARPVVPLEEIKARTRNMRLWFLAGAFAIAMMLGAASALLASYLKLRNVPPVAAEVAEQEPEAEREAVAVAETEPSEEDAPLVESENPENSEPENSEEEVTLTPVTPKEQPAVRRRTVASHTAEPDERRDSRELSEEDELERIRQSVLYDEWQERRARRVRRERRRAERYNHRDLSNLDEIFEGRRRP